MPATNVLTRVTPSALVWEAHGSPVVDGCEPGEGRCFVCCGEVSSGKLVSDWLSTSFTDHDRCRNPSGSHVCIACCYVMARNSPVLGRPAGICRVCDGTLRVKRNPKAGKGKGSTIGSECPKCDGTGMQSAGGNHRNYTAMIECGWDSPVFAKDDTGVFHGPARLGYINASKSEKPTIRAFLERDHAGTWTCSVADNGQLHTLPFARLNAPGRAGLVQFDNEVVSVPGDVSMLGDAAALLTLGVTKGEIESGDYYPRSWAESRAEIDGFESKHARWRGDPWLSLAVWVAQRDEAEFERLLAARKERDAGRKPKKTARVTDRGDDARATKRVPVSGGRQAVALVLGDAAKPDAVSGSTDGERKRVDGQGDGGHANREPSQASLPGFD